MVTQDLQREPVSNRAFFQTKAFWAGSLLWLVVLIAAGMLITGKRGQKDIPSVPSEPEVPQSNSITLTTGKDGTTQIVAPGANPDNPWDEEGIADFAFTDTEGKTVTKADLLGKPWICCFIFTHCALTCPAVTNSMREMQDRLKDRDFRLVSLTVDPVRDTPEILKEYGKSRGADFSRWSFLGGDQRDIYKLINGSFKMPVKEMLGDKREQGFEFIHSNNVMLVDSSGVVRGKFDATKGPAMAALRRELEKMAMPLGPATEPQKSE